MATRLATWLKSQGWSYENLAVRLAVERSTVRRWATGLRIPDPYDAGRIARATAGGVPVSSWPSRWEDRRRAARGRRVRLRIV